MAKSMFDVYEEDIRQIQSLCDKINSYTRFSFRINGHSSPVFEIETAEMERLKSTHAENAPRLGSLGTPFVAAKTDGANAKTQDHAESLNLLQKFIEYLRIMSASDGNISIDLLNSYMVNMDSFTREFCLSYVRNVLKTETTFKQPQTSSKELTPQQIEELLKPHLSSRKFQATHTPLFNESETDKPISQIELEKLRHQHNMEVIAIEHANRMELESLRNRRAFDGEAMEDLEAILAAEDVEGCVVTKELSAIAWCHQQAILMGSYMGVMEENSMGNVYSLESTAKYLFQVFFPNLAQDEKAV